MSLAPAGGGQHGLELWDRRRAIARAAYAEVVARHHRGTDILADGRVVLKAWVRALPQAGEANEALLRLVAKAREVPAAKVTLQSGARGRTKMLRIAGNGEELALRLAALTAAATGRGPT